MTQPSFEEIWQKIVSRLTPGMTIRNWTILQGYFGDDIEIIDVTPDMIVIKIPTAKYLYSVPRDDFQKLWQVWPAYKNGQIDRLQTSPITRFSRYIIDILHWVEQN